MFFIQRICPINQTVFPNQTPILYGLSQYSSNQSQYVQIYVTGENFVYGNSNNSSSNTQIIMILKTNLSQRTVIQTTYYSSNLVSFIVPTNLNPGIYDLYVSVKSTITGGSSAAVSGVTKILFSNTTNYNII